MSNPYNLTAFIDEQGQRRPVSLKIEYPVATSGNMDFYCLVVSPDLLEKEFSIYGDSESETKEQALKFVEFCLNDKKVYDAEGNALVLKLWE